MIVMEATAHLLAIDGAGAGKIWELDKAKLVLGRHPDCDIAVENLDASRHHAQILRVQDEFFVEDLHSTNGTYVNDQLVHGRRKIGECDRIRVSDVTFQFHCGGSAQAPSPGAPAAPSVSVGDEAGGEKLVVLSQRGASHEKIADRSWASLQAELKALLRITQSLRRSLVLDEVLEPILDTLFSIFATADRGFIVLKNEDGSLAPRWSKFRQGKAAEDIRISRTIVDRVMESQQAVLSTDITADKRFDARESLDATPHRSVMCAPLIDGEGRSFGVLHLDGADCGCPFSEDDLEIFVAVAIQTAIAIDNARLHENLAQQQNVEHECDLADRLQQGILPARTPELHGYSFYQYYRPAPNVGGDFYDYAHMHDGRLMLFMADVAGHGLTAAMLAVRLALEIRSRLLVSSHAADMMRNLNQALFSYLPQDHFIKMVAVELVPATGELTLVNAGHQRPLLRSPGNQVSQVGSGQVGLPLGVSGDADYADTRFVLPRGGMLILYTDGTGQATDPSGQVYGDERVRCRAATACGGPAEVGECLANDVRHFIGGCAQRNDICLVCLGRE